MPVFSYEHPDTAGRDHPSELRASRHYDGKVIVTGSEDNPCVGADLSGDLLPAALQTEDHRNAGGARQFTQAGDQRLVLFTAGTLLLIAGFGDRLHVLIYDAQNARHRIRRMRAVVFFDVGAARLL